MPSFMYRFSLLLLLAHCCVASAVVTAQTARVQILHNSPDPTVDVYVNKTRLLNDLVFRQGTPFVEVAANVPVTIGIAAATSDSSGQSIFTFPVTLTAGNNYIVAAGGIAFNAAKPFVLMTNSAARRTATVAGKVDFTVLHGGTDAPAVDLVLHKTTTKLVSNLAYGNYAPYQSVDPAEYYIDLKPAGRDSVIATYRVDLRTLGGQSLCLFASGAFSNIPAPFGLYVLKADGTVSEIPQGTPPPPPSARVQVIHNSPSATVDVYANNQKIADNLAFRSATAFLNLPVSEPVRIGIAPGNSTSAAQATVLQTLTLTANRTYTIMAIGSAGSTATPLALVVNDNARENASIGFQTELTVVHGAPGAPAVDVDELLGTNLLKDLRYGQATPYINLNPEKFDLAVRATGDSVVVASFRADLTTLTGKAATVFASGILRGTPAFGLFAALPDGRVLPLPPTPFVRVQAIHNAADPTVDIYSGQKRLVNDLEYRKATPFVNVPADRDIVFGVAVASSTNFNEAIFKDTIAFASGKTHTLMAAGIPFNATRPFVLLTDDRALETAPAGSVAISVFHGSTNAPAVDVVERGAAALVRNVAYGQFTPYVNTTPRNYFLDVKPAGAATIAGTFRADLTALGSKAVRVFASGALGGSPAFGLFAALADGTVVPLPASPFARVQIIHNSPSAAVDVYVDTMRLLNDFVFRTATPFINVRAGDTARISIAPSTSQSVAQALRTFPVLFENGQTYVVAATGVAGSTTTPLTLAINNQARETAGANNRMEISFLHGSPGAPSIALRIFSGDVVLPQLDYGRFSTYQNIPPDIVLLDIVPAANQRQLLGTWGGNFTGLGGTAATVFASGFVDQAPELDFYVATATGQVLRLPSYARVQILHNAPGVPVDIYSDTTILLNNFGFLSTTDLGLLVANRPYKINVAPADSRSWRDAFYTLDIPALKTSKTHTIIAAGDRSTAAPFALYVNANGREFAETAANVDVALFHGAIGAPPVDVLAPSGNALFRNVAFGQFAPYISVPPAAYTLRVTPANNNNSVVGAYRANLASLRGQALMVFATGYLNPTGTQPPFALWALPVNGFPFPLNQLVNTNELDDKMTALRLSPNPVYDRVRIDLTLTESTELRYQVVDPLGRVSLEGDLGMAAPGETVREIAVAGLPAGLYRLVLRSARGVQTRGFVMN
jgi:Domain of unknown function (DUF4397)